MKNTICHRRKWNGWSKIWRTGKRCCLNQTRKHWSVGEKTAFKWWGRSMNRENMHRQGEYILRKDAALHLQRVPEETSSQRLSGLAAWIKGIWLAGYIRHWELSELIWRPMTRQRLWKNQSVPSGEDIRKMEQSSRDWKSTLLRIPVILWLL